MFMLRCLLFLNHLMNFIHVLHILTIFVYNAFDLIFQPKKVDNPRPLPPPPKFDHSSGEPQKRPSLLGDKPSNGAKSSSTSSSKEEDLDINTPRVCLLIKFSIIYKQVLLKR